MTMQQYCLRWNNHQPNFISVFSSLLNSESLVDVTLAAEGRHLQAHKVVLSACSSYFQSLFTINPCQHPIVILKDVKFIDLKVIIDFMYYGEVNVSQDQLPYILKTAEMLKIKGLAEIPVDQSVSSKIECSMDRAEVLTQADNSWTADNQHSTSIGARQSLSPSPRPLSPFSKRKRLRKTSSGSGSGSAEKIPEEMPLSADGTLTSGIGSLSSVIKSESGSFQSECNLSLKTLKSSTDSESHNRSSSQESIEEKHITLQIPQHQQELTSHIEQQSSNTLDVVGPSTSSNVPQHTVTGIQWNVMDQIGYAHYTTSPTTLQTNTISHCVLATVPQETNTTSPTPNNPQSNNTTFPTQIINSPPQIHKRKRSINPQNEENFIRALEAVRYGGIGFCKAARMYGVNNRTLWLEYKKRGYPNFRLSIKKQNKKDGEPAQAQTQEPEPQQSSDTTRPIIIEEVQANPIALVNDGFYDNKHIDFGPILHRTKYLDAAIVNAQALNFQTINFEQI